MVERVNKAMTIIEWMLGELILPIPPNRVHMVANCKDFVEDEAPAKERNDLSNMTPSEKRKYRLAQHSAYDRNRRAKRAEIVQRASLGLDDRTAKEKIEAEEKLSYRKSNQIPGRGDGTRKVPR